MKRLLIVLHFFLALTATAQPLTYEVAMRQWSALDTAVIGAGGTTAISRPYEGTNNGSLLYIKRKGEKIKKLTVLAGEQFHLIGFTSYGAIAAISRTKDNNQNLVILDPSTDTRKTLALSSDEASEFAGDVEFINKQDLIAIAHVNSYDDGSGQGSLKVTFITSDLTKTSVVVHIAHDSQYGLSHLFGTGNLLLTNYFNETQMSVSQGGSLTSFDSTQLFGVPYSQIQAYPKGFDNYVAAVWENEKSALGYSLYDNTLETVKAIPIDLQTSKIPSFENEVYPTGFKLYKDGSLLATSRSVGYSDTGYLGSSPIKISPSGAVQHLNCHIPPASGRIESIIGVSSDGHVLAQVQTPSGERVLAHFESLDVVNAPNYCVQVNASVTPRCKGSFDIPPGGLNKNGYMDAINTTDPQAKCELVLRFKDSEGKRISGSHIVLRRGGVKTISKKKIRKNGLVKIDLSRVLTNRDACGWNILLNDVKKYQPNGIVIFREQTPACRRI